jgi:hypothetical protein
MWKKRNDHTEVFSVKSLTSRQKILFCVYAMILAMIGDYLLGFGTFSFSDSPDAYMGMTANVVPDWRYASSSVLGFICAALFAVAATELMTVMEKKYGLAESKLYKLFKIANWGGILYFAFIHIGICMLPVVFNAGMEATGSLQASMDMVLRVLKSIAVPMGLGFVICDVFATIGWIGLVVKGKLPVKKIALICNPVVISLFGQLMNYVAEGLDSGFESFGWLLMYLVCALKLADKEERI